MVHRVTTSGNEWQQRQRVTTNVNEWYNEWQRLAISAEFSFFQIKEESITKHPQEKSLNLEEDLEEGLLN